MFICLIVCCIVLDVVSLFIVLCVVGLALCLFASIADSYSTSVTVTLRIFSESSSFISALFLSLTFFVSVSYSLDAECFQSIVLCSMLFCFLVFIQECVVEVSLIMEFPLSSPLMFECLNC